MRVFLLGVTGALGAQLMSQLIGQRADHTALPETATFLEQYTEVGHGCGGGNHRRLAEP